MSSFCVFGVTRAMCKKIAEANVKTRDPVLKRDLTQDEWRERVEQLAAELFQQGGGKASSGQPRIRRSAVCGGLVFSGAEGQSTDGSKDHGVRHQGRQEGRDRLKQENRIGRRYMGSVRAMTSFIIIPSAQIPTSTIFNACGSSRFAVAQSVV